MAEQTQPKTPIRDAQAGIGGLKITTGETPRIEFRLSFPLTEETEKWMIYLARCCRFGAAYVDLRCPAPTLDEAPDDGEDLDKPASNPTELFPGWPKACGKTVKIKGAQATCDDGHVTTTPHGEGCNYIETPEGGRCAILWDNDESNRCELEFGHVGAHRYPRPPLNHDPRLGGRPADEPDTLEF